MREDHERLIGEAASFLEVLEEVSQVAPLDKPVLVVGERGTGKELIAARIHYLSNRWEQDYLKMNCAAISDSLLESELFGHEQGAFTGASKLHKGRFERADKGTLFLDEIATTSMLVQEKLLRIIEYGEFERVGGNKTLRVNARLIAATNEHLPELAEQGQFRQDLLDRLAFDVITLPPLRARHEDILLLAEAFAINMATELGRDYFPGFSRNAADLLQNYYWPGNVRELKNVIERSVYRSDDPDAQVTEIILDPFKSPFRPMQAKIKSLPSVAPSAVENDRASTPHTVPDKMASVAPTYSASGNTLMLPLDLKQASQNFEVELINRALKQSKYNQRKAADLLALTYHQLRGYLKKYDLLKNPDAEES
ncbi:MAG: phage shock protein operon transcriptional activator [Pseudomonadales bacterium]|nr:phage shock protein operon transcriptional activator [Pseudomonadales bacterium]